MSLSDELDFLAWYFTFIDPDFFTCPHCGAEITRDEIEGSFDEAEDVVTCPKCGRKIGKG